MGKNLTQQKRGKGSPTFRAPSFRYKGEGKYPQVDRTKVASGRIIDLVHCQGHSGPLAQLELEDKKIVLMIAPEGIKVGGTASIGDLAPVKVGNVLPLGKIPNGTQVHNIESSPGDGGKFVRSSGASARIITKIGEEVIVLLPSNKRKSFQLDCFATIGIVAGGGRKEKPFLKAGNKFRAMKSKNKYWPSVSGTSMNAVAHPFGGSSSASKGRPTQSSRNDSPGRKVGKIAPSRTGKRKK